MSAVTVIDFKEDNHDFMGVTRNEDGTVTIDLDFVFAGNIEDDTFEWEDGRSGATFSSNGFHTVKLAGNKRNHRGIDIYDFYSFGGWEAGTFNRIEDGGELVEGPQAYLSTMGVAITAHKQPHEVGYFVEANDQVILRGTTYRVSFKRGESLYPVLTQV